MGFLINIDLSNLCALFLATKQIKINIIRSFFVLFITYLFLIELAILSNLAISFYFRFQRLWGQKVNRFG